MTRKLDSEGGMPEDLQSALRFLGPLVTGIALTVSAQRAEAESRKFIPLPPPAEEKAASPRAGSGDKGKGDDSGRAERDKRELCKKCALCGKAAEDCTKIQGQCDALGGKCATAEEGAGGGKRLGKKKEKPEKAEGFEVNLVPPNTPGSFFPAEDYLRVPMKPGEQKAFFEEGGKRLRFHFTGKKKGKVLIYPATGSSRNLRIRIKIGGTILEKDVAIPKSEGSFPFAYVDALEFNPKKKKKSASFSRKPLEVEVAIPDGTHMVEIEVENGDLPTVIDFKGFHETAAGREGMPRAPRLPDFEPFYPVFPEATNARLLVSEKADGTYDVARMDEFSPMIPGLQSGKVEKVRGQPNKVYVWFKTGDLEYRAEVTLNETTNARIQRVNPPVRSADLSRGPAELDLDLAWFYDRMAGRFNFAISPLGPQPEIPVECRGFTGPVKPAVPGAAATVRSIQHAVLSCLDDAGGVYQARLPVDERFTSEDACIQPYGNGQPFPTERKCRGWGVRVKRKY